MAPHCSILMLHRLQVMDRPLSRQPVSLRRAATPSPFASQIPATPTFAASPRNSPSHDAVKDESVDLFFISTRLAAVEHNPPNPSSPLDREGSVCRTMGYAAFEQAIDRVLQRPESSGVSIDVMWKRLATWIDKFYLEHDSSTYAETAAQVIQGLPTPDSPKCTARINAACTMLHDAFAILGHQFAAMAPVLRWAREELMQWLVVDPVGIIANPEEDAVSSPHVTDLHPARFALFGGKTYRHVLRGVASRLPQAAAVEYAEKIKGSLLTLFERRVATFADKHMAICFRLWRRHVQLSRRGLGRTVRALSDGDPLSDGAASSILGSTSFRLEERQDQLSELRRMRSEREQLIAEITALNASNRELLRQVETLSNQSRATVQIPSEHRHDSELVSAYKLAVREIAQLKVKLMDTESSLHAVLGVDLYPPIGLSVQPRQSATDIAVAFLTQYAKKVPLDFGDPDQLVASYAVALHARCSPVVTLSRLHAIIFPDSIAIRKLQLRRTCEAHFGVPGELLDAALVSGTPEKHVPVVSRLIIACQRRMRRPMPDPSTLEVLLKQQLEYANVLEAIILRHPYADAAAGMGATLSEEGMAV